MARAYSTTIPTPPGIPEHILVRMYALRTDDKQLTPEDLRALAAVYPPTDEESRAALEATVARATKRTKHPSSKAAKPSPAKRLSAKTSAPKRKAAKKPTRTR